MDHLALDDSGVQHPISDWEQAAAAVLRKSRRLGEDDPDTQVWDRLTRTTLDGVPITPLGVPAATDDLATSGRPLREGAWQVRQRVEVVEPARANQTILTELENGATSIWLRSPAAVDLDTVLREVLLDVAPVVLDATGDAGALATAFLDHVAGVRLEPTTNLGVPASQATAELATAASDAGVLAFVVDATRVHDEGASDGQELGWSLAAGADYLRSLTQAGVELDEALELLEFRYAATDEQFVTIAKLRAARRVWARLVELCGSEVRAQRQHAVTSRAMLSARDPWVNLMRGTVAAFAAGVGGADAVTVQPFDEPLGRPDALARRIARNTSTLLIEESHVAAVTDPAGGSYAVEQLTDELAAAAWAELGRIETDGPDAFADRVAATREERAQQVATRKRPITGLSEFPNLEEKLPERDPDPTAEPVQRYGAAFEAFRADPPAAPVFLATMGPLAAYTARAGFASNLLGAGGVAVTEAGPTDGVAEVIERYREADSPAVVCLAGTDPTYAEWGAELVSALREAGARWVVVAGKPGDLGVDDSAAMGVDAVAFLSTMRENLR